MVFRKDEAQESGFERAVRYLTPKELPSIDKKNLRNQIEDWVIEYGPVVSSYPTWHPLVSNHDGKSMVTTPSERCGYKGLDHTILFANAFISCPYQNGQTIVNSVQSIKQSDKPYSHAAFIEVEKISMPFYAPSTEPVLVTCDWLKGLTLDRTIPKNIAIPLMLEREIPCWRWSSVGETWESMRPYFLGEPCGKRSSLFVDQETGQMMKKIWNSLIYTGMYGPIKV